MKQMQIEKQTRAPILQPAKINIRSHRDNVSHPSSSSLLEGAGKGAPELSWEGNWIYPFPPKGFRDWSLENTEFEGSGAEGCASGALRDHDNVFIESRKDGDAMTKHALYPRLVSCKRVFVCDRVGLEGRVWYSFQKRSRDVTVVADNVNWDGYYFFSRWQRCEGVCKGVYRGEMGWRGRADDPRPARLERHKTECVGLCRSASGGNGIANGEDGTSPSNSKWPKA